MVTIPKFMFPFQIYFLSANNPVNISTWMSNWHFNTSKMEHLISPSNLVFPHVSKWYLYSFCYSGQKSWCHLDFFFFYSTSNSSEILLVIFKTYAESSLHLHYPGLSPASSLLSPWHQALTSLPVSVLLTV